MFKGVLFICLCLVVVVTANGPFYRIFKQCMKDPGTTTNDCNRLTDKLKQASQCNLDDILKRIDTLERKWPIPGPMGAQGMPGPMGRVGAAGQCDKRSFERFIEPYKRRIADLERLLKKERNPKNDLRGLQGPVGVQGPTGVQGPVAVPNYRASNDENNIRLTNKVFETLASTRPNTDNKQEWAYIARMVRTSADEKLSIRLAHLMHALAIIKPVEHNKVEWAIIRKICLQLYTGDDESSVYTKLRKIFFVLSTTTPSANQKEWSRIRKVCKEWLLNVPSAKEKMPRLKKRNYLDPERILYPLFDEMAHLVEQNPVLIDFAIAGSFVMFILLIKKILFS